MISRMKWDDNSSFQNLFRAGRRSSTKFASVTQNDTAMVHRTNHDRYCQTVAVYFGSWTCSGHAARGPWRVTRNLNPSHAPVTGLGRGPLPSRTLQAPCKRFGRRIGCLFQSSSWPRKSESGDNESLAALAGRRRTSGCRSARSVEFPSCTGGSAWHTSWPLMALLHAQGNWLCFWARSRSLCKAWRPVIFLLSFARDETALCFGHYPNL